MVAEYLTRSTRERGLRIYVTQVFVNDQQQALEFYTGVLGFEKKQDVPLGQHRWLTVTSKEDSSGVELLLEPSGHPAVAPYREALVADGIPAASFAVENLIAEHSRLDKLGVQFTQPPVQHDGYTTAVFDDTCGNLIQIIEMQQNEESQVD